MERREMVEDIAIMLMSRSDLPKEERIDWASEILEELEIKGMLPPGYREDIVIDGEEYVSHKNEWEPVNG